jgi:hypothetical protein
MNGVKEMSRTTHGDRLRGMAASTTLFELKAVSFIPIALAL